MRSSTSGEFLLFSLAAFMFAICSLVKVFLFLPSLAALNFAFVSSEAGLWLYIPLGIISPFSKTFAHIVIIQ